MAELSLARKTKAELIEEVETLKRGLRALATDLDKQDVARADADRLQHLYDQSPIAIWDEDWSGIRPTIEEIRLQPIKDLEVYFKERPNMFAGWPGRPCSSISTRQPPTSTAPATGTGTGPGRPTSFSRL